MSTKHSHSRNLLGVPWRFLKEEPTSVNSDESSKKKRGIGHGHEGVALMEREVKKTINFPSKVFESTKTVSLNIDSNRGDHSSPLERVKAGREALGMMFSGMKREESKEDTREDDSDAENTEETSAHREKGGTDVDCIQGVDDAPDTSNVLWRNHTQIKVASRDVTQMLDTALSQETLNFSSDASREEVHTKELSRLKHRGGVHRSAEEEREWEERFKKQKARFGYGSWYMPASEWNRKNRRGMGSSPSVSAKKSTTVAPSEAMMRQSELQEKIPKLFIAKEYKKFIITSRGGQLSTGDDSSLPHYLRNVSNCEDAAT
jgi:hypothetical protein